MTYRFNEGDTTRLTNQRIQIITSEPLLLSRITLYGINTSNNDGYVEITVSDNSNTFTQRVTTEKNSDVEAMFTPNFVSEKNSTITITVTTSNTTIYIGSTRNDEKYISGLGAYISSAYMYNCEIEAALETLVWISGISGYPELYSNPHIPWEDFERDDDGYPLNPSVWKKDENNNGFVWIYGFNKHVPSANARIWLNTESGFVAVDLYINTKDGLLPCSVSLYLNTEGGLKPITLA